MNLVARTGYMKGRYHLRVMGVDCRIILKRILNKYGVGLRTGFKCRTHYDSVLRYTADRQTDRHAICIMSSFNPLPEKKYSLLTLSEYA